MNINATLIGEALWFLFFIWITMKFIWPPLQRAMTARQQQIADGLAAGERGKQDLAQAQKRVDDALNEARGRAAEIIAQAEKRGTQIVEESKASAKTGSMPDEHPAIIEMVPVGAMVVMLEFRSGRPSR